MEPEGSRFVGFYPDGETVVTTDTGFTPVGTLQHKAAVRHNPDALPDSDRRRDFDSRRTVESTTQAVRDDVLVDLAHVEGRGESVLVSGGQRTGDIDVTRGIEVLEIGPVSVQHAEHRIDDARDLSHPYFRGIGICGHR